ncbi:MAG: CoA transferase [Rhodospirillaceae bacterium]|nr:CoA transferase [Rhodospirillaceae bacterium]
MLQAFDSIRILDFTQVVAGPYAAQLLGNQGAEVVKVEPARGDQLRQIFKTSSQPADADSAAYELVNRGKRSVSIDLKNPAGRDAILKVAAGCDVFLENFRPGVMARLGLDYDAVRKVRPDIVYCSISGYGQTGPLAGEPAYDGTIQAISGMMSNNGHPETGPTRAGFLPVDVPSAFLAAYAIAAALFRRAQTGRGQHIDLAMIDAAILMQLSVFSRVFTDGSGGGLIGNRSTAAVLTADAFPCSDGYIAVSAVTRAQGRIVLELAGLDPDLWDDFDPNDTESPQSREVTSVVYAAFRRRPMKEWEARLRGAGQSASCVLDARAVADLDQMAHRAVFQDDPADRPAAPRTIGGAFMASEDGPAIAGRVSAIGEDTEAVLAEFGFSDREVAALREAGAIRSDEPFAPA